MQVIERILGAPGRVADRIAFVIFGQRAPGAGHAAHMPGNGGHGGGNQVPPYVPYNPYWDRRRRSR
jgi:hypothetical protein